VNKVYVAGSTSDVENVQTVQNWFRREGWDITFDWTGAEGQIRTDGSWDRHPIQGARIATTEIDAVALADLYVVLSPESRPGLGCWIEMGAALASGVQCWVVKPARDSVFWQHPLVRRFGSFAELAEAIPAAGRERPTSYPVDRIELALKKAWADNEQGPADDDDWTEEQRIAMSAYNGGLGDAITTIRLELDLSR